MSVSRKTAISLNRPDAAALKHFEAITRDYSGVGLDVKVESYIEETKAKLAEEEKVKQLKEDKSQAAKKSKKTITDQIKKIALNRT